MAQSPPREILLSAAAGMLAARALRGPLWLVLSALVARLLGPDGLGTWAMVLAAAMLANQVIALWTQSLTQRFGRSEWLTWRRLDATWALRWPLLAGGGLVFSIVLTCTPGSWHFRLYGLTDSQRWLILPVLIGLWLMNEAQGLQQVRARFAPMAWSSVLADVLLIAVVATLLGLTQYAGLTLEFTGKAVTLALCSAMVWGVLLALELRAIPLRWRLPEGATWRRALLFAAPLIPGYLIGYLAEWCDYLLIGHFLGAREVGLFHAAYQYMLLLVGLPTAVAAVLLPQVISAIDRREEKALGEFVGRTAPQMILLWALASLALLSVLPWIFALLTGVQFADAQVVLQVLLVAVPGAIATHIYGVLHFAQGRLGVANVALFGAKLLVNFVVSLALIPTLGLIGAAIGSGVSYLILQWLFLLDQHRRFGLTARTASRALALAQAAGVALAFTPVGAMRLACATIILISLLLWIRRTAIFAAPDIQALLPTRLAGITPIATRMLCRDL